MFVKMMLRTEFDEKEQQILKTMLDKIGTRLHYPFNEFIRVVQNSKQSKKSAGTTQDPENERKAKV